MGTTLTVLLHPVPHRFSDTPSSNWLLCYALCQTCYICFSDTHCTTLDAPMRLVPHLLFCYTLYHTGCSDAPCTTLAPVNTFYHIDYLFVLIHPVPQWPRSDTPCIFSWEARYLVRVCDSLSWRGNCCLAALQRNCSSLWM